MELSALTSDPSAGIPIASAQHSLEWTLSVQRQWEFQQMGQMSAQHYPWGLTSLNSIADAQAMDRQYEGS